MLRIGIDFDNTIACYDQVFHTVALALGYLTQADIRTKAAIKAHILSRPDGDLDWQRLQGQVYGRYMLQAELFPGLFEFIYLSKLRGSRVFIVSHKTEYGHFDKDRISLRKQAIKWMRVNRFFAPDGLSLGEEDVFFHATREAKLHRISDLGCSHFIDDLEEVFTNRRFPGKTDKILFRPGAGETHHQALPMARSWREISLQVYGSWTETEISTAAQANFPELNIRQAQLKKGRGNSRIYEINGLANHYALKIYPDRQHDQRPRIATEFSACRLLHKHGFPVPETVAIDERLGWGVYQWLTGVHIKEPTEHFLSQALDFVKGLSAVGFNRKELKHLPDASEACLSGSEIVSQIDRRLQTLSRVESNELREYLKDKFMPLFDCAVRKASQACTHFFSSEIPRTLQIPSPSDFGSHNALQDDKGRVFFIDLEYFGWDDPVKLVSDFYWHPGMCLTDELRRQWILRSDEIFRSDPDYPQRIKHYLPLYGLRWCLILLNEFIPKEQAKRAFASTEHADAETARHRQLNKANTMLREVEQFYE